MKATITGCDDLSKRILIDLKRGMKVSRIPKHYPVSLDQAKKLSRLNKMLNLAREHLNEDLNQRLQHLGIKSLPLSRLFRQADWGGIIEILSVVTDGTTRDDLELLIDALHEKRNRIKELKEETDLSLLELEKLNQSLQTKEREILLFQQEWNKHLQVFEPYLGPIRSFLEEYLGVFDGKLVLAKRLCGNWEQHLREQGIIKYHGNQSVYYINDVYRFVESLQSRRERGLKYRSGTDESLGLTGSFVNSMNKLKQKLREVQEKKAAIEEEVIRIKQKTTQSYMKITETPDYLSADDLKRLKELQVKALKWLFKRGFIAMTDFTLPNGKKTDIFAYNESQIVIFKIKVSKNDLITDYKWTDYLPYCHDFFFLTPDKLKDEVVSISKTQSINCGQFIETSNSIQLIRADERNVEQIKQEDELKFAAAQYLARRFIFGY
ncbi:MmcB family DNA repair protein (plasmid) [Niallia sp. XMNu-256]|uniref:MmcB family DNA repair protein n=1 Tax=Niallia sp. XMNu-256 TaxID=3082444 RepID=UPI0030CD6709